MIQIPFMENAKYALRSQRFKASSVQFFLLLPYFLKEHFQMTSVVIVKLQDGLNKKSFIQLFSFLKKKKNKTK